MFTALKTQPCEVPGATGTDIEHLHNFNNDKFKRRLNFCNLMSCTERYSVNINVANLGTFYGFLKWQQHLLRFMGIIIQQKYPRTFYKYILRVTYAILIGLGIVNHFLVSF